MNAKLYKKPNKICKELNDREKSLLELDDNDFIETQKKEIARDIQNFGYTLRFANYDDIDTISKFIEARYTKLEGNELSPYDFYRFIKFGNGLLLEKEQEIMGCVFEIAYDTPCKTSYPLRLVLDKSIVGQNLGLHMVYYLSLHAKKRGSMENRSVISFSNHVSLYVQLNKQGWIANAFNPEIKGLTNYFEVCLPLSKEGLLQNKIDTGKLIKFIREKNNGKDYLLIDCNDKASIVNAFKDKFLMAAFVRKGILDSKNYFFFMPATTLKYKEQDTKQ